MYRIDVWRRWYVANFCSNHQFFPNEYQIITISFSISCKWWPNNKENKIEMYSDVKIPSNIISPFLKNYIAKSFAMNFTSYFVVWMVWCPEEVFCRRIPGFTVFNWKLQKLYGSIIDQLKHIFRTIFRPFLADDQDHLWRSLFQVLFVWKYSMCFIFVFESHQLIIVAFFSYKNRNKS